MSTNRIRIYDPEQQVEPTMPTPSLSHLQARGLIRLLEIAGRIEEANDVREVMGWKKREVA